jgi:hypothetical protein
VTHCELYSNVREKYPESSPSTRRSTLGRDREFGEHKEHASLFPLSRDLKKIERYQFTLRA